MKYKVLAGKHTERDGKRICRYGKDNIVESDSDLIKRFPNKFELVSDEAEVSAPISVSAEKNQDSIKKQQIEADKEAQEEKELLEGDDKDEGDEGDEIGLTVVKVAKGKYNVHKTINGETTDDIVNEEAVSKKAADAIVKAGISALEEDEDEDGDED